MHAAVGFLTTPVGSSGRVHFRHGSNAEGEDAPFESRSHVSYGGNGGEGPVLQVWHLLASIAAIMAVLLAAHYAFVMSAVKAEIQNHELSSTRSSAMVDAKLGEHERRINLLEQVDVNVSSQYSQMRADVERIEKDLTLVKERQAQVRAKLKLNGGGGSGEDK